MAHSTTNPATPVRTYRKSSISRLLARDWDELGHYQVDAGGQAPTEARGREERQGDKHEEEIHHKFT